MYIWPVRIIAFILSIYILALNFTPCEDSVTVENEFKVELSQNGDIDESHTDIDLCSPFCQCNCCQIHTTTANSLDFVVASNLISTHLILHFDSLGKDITFSIFQPPKQA